MDNNLVKMGFFNNINLVQMDNNLVQMGFCNNINLVQMGIL